MPNNARIIGAARSTLSAEQYKAQIKTAISEFGNVKGNQAKQLNAFLNQLDYVKIDVKGEEGWSNLASKVRKNFVNAHYFSVAPSLFGDIAKRLNDWKIATPDSRIVVEKPFGRDLESSQKLNASLAAQFDEGQIYRIDHYLGKETVQNLMAVRFGNVLFEPLWNAQYIDHIQITVAETVGVGGRGAYYDTSGAMRDMVQNHLMQLLCLIAMEPPARFDPDAVRDEKLKVIRALGDVKPHQIVRGQYDGALDAQSYRQDVKNPRSFTESYLCLKAHIENWRWSG
jgi:glucose-6-phosphate 1-dehydrogenase